MPAIEDEDRRIASLLLRGARQQAELAEEEGSSAYLNDAVARRAPGRVNDRLLKGEVSQVRSFNKRAGVDAAKLPALPDSAHDTPLERERKALDREWVRRAHELRSSTTEPGSGTKAMSTACDRGQVLSANFEDRTGNDFGWGARGACFDYARGACMREDCRFVHDPRDRFGDGPSGSNGGPDPQRKRQRVGAKGALDILAAEEAAARQADDDVELANPLMRGPPVQTKSSVAVSAPSDVQATAGGAAVFWPSRKLRVRIVDEVGDYKKWHTRKGVVQCVDSSALQVEVKLDGEDGKVLRAVPQALLETVVSKACINVEIVRGSERGMLGQLLRRDSRRNIAVVRLGRAASSAELELALDDVCEFI